MRIVRAPDCRVMPWKNGGGSTTEIAVHPQDAGMDDFLWRVSMARVEGDGPFSRFDGIDRTLTILEGAGIRLTVDSVTTELTQTSSPHAFRGDVPASATLIDGPVTDLNVMTRRGALAHRVVRTVWPVDVKPGLTSLVVSPHGGCVVTTASGRADLEAGDTAIVENEAMKVAPASVGTPVYVVEIAPVG
ncbi:MAG: HutD family protein [Rhizobiaceae bacterium]